MKVCSTCRRCYSDRVESCTDQFHPPLSASIPGDPDMIHGYHLELLLSSEFSVELFRAKRSASGPSCLIKVVSGDDVDKFLTQAHTASQFFHPNATDVYEAGLLDDGRAFLVMEDPDGITIRRMLRSDEPQPLLRSVEIVRQAAEALHAMHLAGLAHGAVNPRNIVVTSDRDGELLVRVHNPDLGSVAQRSIVSNKFLIDTALESIRYFAPEQFNGEPPCAQTDVYSLGVVFFEMLTGAPPFDAPTATALIHKLRTQSPPDIRITDFNLRMLVTHCLMESLQKQSRLRQVSADLFARQLRHIEQLATHISTPPPAGVVPPQPVVTKSPTPAAVIIGPPVESNAPALAEMKREVSPTKPVVENPSPSSKPERLREVMPVVKPGKPPRVETNPINATRAEEPPAAVVAETISIERPLAASRVEVVVQEAPVEEAPVKKEAAHDVVVQNVEPAVAAVPTHELQLEAEASTEPKKYEPIEILTTEPPEARKPEARSHRSRLRRLKKKLHSMSSDIVSQVNAAVKDAIVPEPATAAVQESVVAEPLIREAVEIVIPKAVIADVRAATPVPETAVAREKVEKVEPPPAVAEVNEETASPQPVIAVKKAPPLSVIARTVSIPTTKPTQQPKKIAFETPDDDIPSVDDVLEVLAKDGETIEPTPVFQEPAVPRVAKVQTPPIVETETPQVAKVQTPQIVAAKTPQVAKVQTPAIVETETQQVARVQTPSIVETKTPQVAKVQTPQIVEAKTPQVATVQTPVIETKTPEVVETKKPRVAETETPAAPKQKPAFAAAAGTSSTSREAPRVTSPPAGLSKPTATAQPPAMQRNKAVPPAPQQRRPQRAPQSTAVIDLPDPDEITRVRPPARRIRIEIEGARPASPRNWNAEPAFTPTLLGERKSKPKARASSDDMFGAYYNDPGPLSSVSYRSYATAAGVAALVMLFLFAGTSLSRYFQSAGSGDSTTAIASSTTQAELTLPRIQPKVEQPAAETSVPAMNVATNNVEPERTQPSVVKSSKEKEDEPRSDSRVAKNSVADRKPAVIIPAPRTPEPKAKKASAVEPVRPKTVVIVKNRSSLMTRPRIVAEPK